MICSCRNLGDLGVIFVNTSDLYALAEKWGILESKKRQIVQIARVRAFIKITSIICFVGFARPRGDLAAYFRH
jgi:hypothetical protein